MCAKIQKIRTETSEERLQQDLQRYRQLALQLGAQDAQALATQQIIVDDRVRMKCLHPICQGYGTNIHCPPYVGSLDDTRKLVRQYQYALFIMLRVPAEELVGARAYETESSTRSAQILNDIVSQIESTAFYDGYHLATGFSTGCKGLWCPTEACAALVPGQSCRHPLKARAGMDAMGMDAYTMAAQAGWDIYPLGKDADPHAVPYGTRLGLVLIA